MMNLFKYKLLSLLFTLSSVILGAFSNYSEAQASNAKNNQDSPRWFEIEVIVYKSTSLDGLTEESWKNDIQLEQSKNLVDFLQPYEESSKANEQSANLSGDQTSDNLADADEAINLATTEKPFMLLNDDLLELKPEAKILNRHPKYRVLFHNAWRQPVLGPRSAPSIRIAGGEDYSENYEYNGAKKSTLEKATIDGINRFSDTTNNAINNQNKNPEQESDKVKIPWVPELDGDIKIYLSRYLHVKTNLYLRRPDKEEMEVIDLELLNNNQLLSDQVSNNIKSSDVNSKLNSAQADSPIIVDLNNPQNPKENNQTNKEKTESKSTFSWELDDNFLDNETEKMYIERLFNYSLKQSRRMKSGELHYFDHPLIGVLIMIKPYDAYKEASGTEDILPATM